MNIFWCRQCAFVFPIYVLKYRKYTIDRWIVVYTVCAPAIISPLKQWLDSYAKTRLKMCHTFKHFIHMQYFLLLTNLVIVFVHWVSTGVLYEPRQYSLFWDYIPESKLCFASICAARPVHIQSHQYRSCSTVNQRWGGWGCEVSCGGHHRPSGKTTTGSALDGAVFHITQILAYLVHNMSRSQLYLGFGHFGWLPVFFRSITFWRAYG